MNTADMMNDQNFLTQLENTVKGTADSVLSHFFRQTTARIKVDGSIVTEADTQMQEKLGHSLAQLFPQVQLLGEEMDDNQQQRIINNNEAYWCIDPLDGTNNFHHGVPLFAVSVALIVDREIHTGVVYDPIRQEIFSAMKGHGLHIDGQPYQKPPQPAELARSLASVDFKRLRKSMKLRLAEKMPFKSQRNIGTCALEWAWVAAGRLQLLLHGGEKFWDYAAGCLLVSESGGHSCTEQREPIFNNTLENRSVIAASSEELHRSWSKFLLD